MGNKAEQIEGELVTVATLVRGKVYFYKNERFDRGVARPVTEDLGLILETIVDERIDMDNEVYEKPLFKVEYGVPKSELETEEPAPVRRQLQRPRRHTHVAKESSGGEADTETDGDVPPRRNRLGSRRHTL